MKIKKLILPLLIVVIFAAVYLIGLPFYKSYIAQKKIYEDFEKSLTNLEIKYEKAEDLSTEYGAKKAYSYTADERRIILYIFDKNSEDYKNGEKGGFIISKENPELILYGFFTNNCALFMEKGFPKEEEVLNLFANISKEYADAIQKRVF